MSTVFIAGNIKMNRERMGLSKEALGKRIGVSGVTIGYWEQGKTTPRMKKVEQLAAVFGVEWDQLIVNEPVKNTEDIFNALPGLSEERKKALEMVMKVSNDDLALLLSIMERTLKSE
ncbi:helix-turn-helix transcriptional regulator [Paenibacillus gorillae]|uniref:helix-turn-helix transcriptional regulator n=1 Tax=Paenibacillus gorillae TaxID=1243662 RepID=UPI0004B836EB|nr:helix-turn-helix transcriptional regulator [Paenibacillus gorillae]